MDLVELDLQAGIAAERAGNPEQARACYLRVLESHPRHELALLRLSNVLPSTEHALLCLEQLLTINPRHVRARELQELLRVRLLLEEAALVPASTPQVSTARRRKRLGEALIAAGLLTYRQLDRALVVQARLAQRGQPLRLGEILLRLDLLQPGQLEAALAGQIAELPAARRADGALRIGEYLVQQGRVTPAQVQQALALQQRLGQQGQRVPLGELLVRYGYLQPDELHRALLDWQQHYPLVLD